MQELTAFNIANYLNSVTLTDWLEMRVQDSTLNRGSKKKIFL